MQAEERSRCSSGGHRSQDREPAAFVRCHVFANGSSPPCDYGGEMATIPPRTEVEPTDFTESFRRISAFSS